MEYKDTKLIVFLRTFSKEELNEFEKFLNSPFFKQSRDPLPLFKILKKYHPGFNSDRLNETDIFTELYPGSDYSNSKSQNNFRSLSSYLLKAVEEYLYISGIKNNNILRNRIVLEKLLDRNLLKYYDQYLLKADNDLKFKESISGSEDIEKILLESLNSRYYTLKLDLKKYLESNFMGIEVISAYFWLNLFRNAKIKFLTETYSGVFTGNKSIDNFIESADMEKILKIHKDNSRYTDLCFNYYTYMCLKKNNDIRFYNKAKKIFFENKSGISRADKSYYYSDLININASNRIVSEELNLHEQHSLIISCLKDKAYKVKEEDFMQPDFYRNAVLFSCKLRKYDWAENFINEYTGELLPEFRDNLKYYSMAVICYGKEDFEKSLENISRVKYDLAVFKIDVKIIMLRIFYELDMAEQFYSLADTFKHYINNSKRLSDIDRIAYWNYIKYFIKIIKLKISFDKYEEEILRDQIDKEKYLYEKNWLKEKLKKLSL